MTVATPSSEIELIAVLPVTKSLTVTTADRDVFSSLMPVRSPETDPEDVIFMVPVPDPATLIPSPLFVPPVIFPELTIFMSPHDLMTHG